MSEENNQFLERQSTRVVNVPGVACYQGWRVGDLAVRKGRLCTITEIHFEIDPPSVTVFMHDNKTQADTEFEYLIHASQKDYKKFEKEFGKYDSSKILECAKTAKKEKNKEKGDSDSNDFEKEDSGLLTNSDNNLSDNDTMDNIHHTRHNGNEKLIEAASARGDGVETSNNRDDDGHGHHRHNGSSKLIQAYNIPVGDIVDGKVVSGETTSNVSGRHEHNRHDGGNKLIAPASSDNVVTGGLGLPVPSHHRHHGTNQLIECAGGKIIDDNSGDTTKSLLLKSNDSIEESNKNKNNENENDNGHGSSGNDGHRGGGGHIDAPLDHAHHERHHGENKFVLPDAGVSDNNNNNNNINNKHSNMHHERHNGENKLIGKNNEWKNMAKKRLKDEQEHGSSSEEESLTTTTKNNNGASSSSSSASGDNNRNKKNGKNSGSKYGFFGFEDPFFGFGYNSVNNKNNENENDNGDYENAHLEHESSKKNLFSSFFNNNNNNDESTWFGGW